MKAVKVAGIIALSLFLPIGSFCWATPQQEAPRAESPLAATVIRPEYDGSGPFALRPKYLRADQMKNLLLVFLPESQIKAETVNNVVVVMCSGSEYHRILALMEEIDVPPRQVMFEAEAVEVSRADIKNLGIDWGSITALPSAPPYEQGNAFRVEIGNGYGIDVKGQINRLIEDKKGRLLASPRIAALDGQTAQIMIGDRLAVENRTIVSGSELITVTYVDVGIKLEVTPFVNDDNTITTRIRPEVSNKADVTKNGNPNIRTRQSDTTLRVKNGETIVLGGLIQREEIRHIFKFPLLGDIPLVGQYLFRTTSTEKRETELVILITPKMIGPGGGR